MSAGLKTPKEQEEERLLLQQEIGKAPLASGNVPSAFSAPASASPTTTSPTAAPSLSGGFVNLDKYRQVNDASAKNIAKQVGNEASGKFGAADTELSLAKTAADNAVTAGSVKPTDIPASALRNVTDLNDAQMAATKRALSGYDGINSFEETEAFKKYASVYDKAAQDANKYNDSAFRSEILKNKFNTADVKRSGGYTVGMANLDNDLVDSQASIIQGQIGNARKALDGKATSASGDITKRVGAEKGVAEATRKYVKENLEGGKLGLQTNVGNALKSQNDKNLEIEKNLADPSRGLEKVEDGAIFSTGDVISEGERAQAIRLKELLGEDVLSDMDKKTGKYIKVRNKPKPIVPPSPVNTGGGVTIGKKPTKIKPEELR